MSSKGWIRLHRQLMDNQLWLAEPFTKGQAWVDLLMMASHRSDKVFKGNQVYENQPGLVTTSVSKLAERWQWSRHKVNDYLTLLENLGQIYKKRTGKRTAVFIVKWGVYQDAGTDKRTVSGQFEDSLRTVSGHNQEGIKNVIKNGGEGGSCASSAQPSAADIENFVFLWNGVDHTANISRIAQGTERYKNLCECIGLVGAGGITRAIEKIRDSEYLIRKGHVKFDSYMNPNAIIKLLEGAYDEDYRNGGKTDGFEFGWNPDTENHD